jgi:hypothetical protein
MLAIESYGRRWRRDRVYWRAGRATMQLKGHARGNQARVIDFKDQIGIYVPFDSNGQAVYVGQAGVGNKTLWGRLKDHHKNRLRDRWTHFSWFGLRGRNPKSNTLSKHHTAKGWIYGKQRKDALYETEAVIMAIVEPPLNRQGPRWAGAEEYLQVPDERIPSESAPIEAIAAAVDEIRRAVDKVNQRVDRAKDAKEIQRSLKRLHKKVDKW